MNQSNATAVAFLKLLKKNKDKLTVQQFRTLKGQAFSGDIASAHRGFQNIVGKHSGGKKAKVVIVDDLQS